METYLKEWASDLLRRQPTGLSASSTVTGERRKHLGPRYEFARVQITAEPSNGFEVVNHVPNTPELEAYDFPRIVVFGILDVLMVTNSVPITNIRINIDKVETDPVETNPMALRHAGRDAARKLIRES